MDLLGRRAPSLNCALSPPADTRPAPGRLRAETRGDWLVRIHVDDLTAAAGIREAIRRNLAQRERRLRGVAVVCVGTDRSTGDALGPLTGHRLKALVPEQAPVFGTLEDPVHAGNLAEKVADIARGFPAHTIVAVDACLGSLENVGTICVGQGALRPGAGVNKVLPPVGDLHVTGVVNVGGFMEYFVLQNTRLHLVMRMSTVIAEGLAGLFAAHGAPQSGPDNRL
jgi:putative sporulation protein YyaC